MVPDWSAFADDLDPDREVAYDRPGLHDVLQRLVTFRGLQLDWEQADALPDPVYVDAFAMNLPLADEEKQALLEAEDVGDRARLLVGLAQMVLNGGEHTSPHAH